MKNKLINGDSGKVLRSLEEETVDLVVTSPPYDNLRDYDKSIVWNFEKFKEIAKGLYKVMKIGGIVVWVVSDATIKGNKTLTSYKQALYFQELGFNIYDVIIYEKSGAGPPHPNRYFNTFEYMFVLSKGKPKTINILKDKKNTWGGHQTYTDITRREKDGTLTNKGRKTINEFGVRTNIWRYNNGSKYSTSDKFAHEHPAIFPEKLVQDHILSWSNEGDTVLDPFGGSGTTIKMAELLNRKWIYIETSSEYMDIARRRIESLKEIKDSDIIYDEI